ncbi:MAG TPA: NrfD/PsrC family molybdoenzyme membrane anchor subunit [Chthoniobacterales bacterium]|nr:NrfD/PsrC family molybdoenzyme membrane anchor subunit [Chthoniobacterales bacterium]
MATQKLVENEVVKSSSSPHLLVSPSETLESASAKISGIVLERKHPPFWWVSFGVAFVLLLGLLYGITILFAIGVGIWGINIPVAWGFAIVNFVWWIGIGHAGTFISAILLLLLQKWRNSINRLAEAMTLFAVACAGLFPLLHLGRPWTFFWILPYPNTMGLWPQFRSPLVWDVFAVFTYFTVSLIFWYTGLIPDLATMRDRAKTRLSKIGFGIMSLGWRGSAAHWKHFQTVYLILAGLSTPLVLSVHSVVSTDFAVANIPGWHTTIFPPFFVAGAIYSGFAMVLNIMIPLRYVYGLESVITERHLKCMAGVMLATGLMVGYGYVMETFTGWYSGDIFEQYLVINRAIGPYGWTYWLLLTVNIVIPQLLWIRRIRSNPIFLFAVSLSINVGMWLERFVIVIVSLHRDFLPSSWGIYAPTGWDWLILFGSIGLFVSLVFLFVRFLPMIPMSEIKEIVAERGEEAA